METDERRVAAERAVYTWRDKVVNLTDEEFNAKNAALLARI
jgi:hypothetical protein